MSAFLSLFSSLLWGTGDFAGGTLSRRFHPLGVLRQSQLLALAGLVVIATAVGGWSDATGYLPWAIAAGVAGLVGLTCFYAALAEGTMGVVAPIAATGVIVPVAVGLARGDRPAPIQLLGIAVAIAGVVLVSGPERGIDVTGGPPVTRSRRPVLLAIVAALGFGAVLVLVAEGSKSSVIMTLTTMRATNVVLGSLALVFFARDATIPGRAALPTLLVVAGTDAGANGTYAIATQHGLVSLTAVLASLYPAVTALLAWRIHGEHLGRVQLIGAAATLTGVVLIAAGG